MAGVNIAPPGCTTTSTPMKPITTATHCPTVTRSFSNGADSAVTSTGARKLTAVASASGRYCRPVVNSRLVLNRLRARNVCNSGRRVRSTLRPALGRKMPAISSVCTTYRAHTTMMIGYRPPRNLDRAS
ncbi:hypothetical protein D3C81_1162200 [compost metagenome]